MKIILLALAFVLSSCASIKTTSNIVKTMETYTFKHSAKSVYAAAKRHFANMPTIGKKIEVTNHKKRYQGATAWVVTKSVMGGKEYKNRSRFLVIGKKVAKNKSTLKIFSERMSNVGGTWSGTGAPRDAWREYLVLKEIDAKAALAIENKAKADAKK